MFLYPAVTACCIPSVGVFASGPKKRLNIFGTSAAVRTSMMNKLLTSNFLITLIKAIKKNKIVIQNGWDGYRIKPKSGG